MNQKSLRTTALMREQLNIEQLGSKHILKVQIFDIYTLLKKQAIIKLFV